jgi:hypothetical protein
MNLKATVVVNETQFAEPIHKNADPRSRGTYNLSQRLLAHLRNHQLGRALIVAKRKHGAYREGWFKIRNPPYSQYERRRRRNGDPILRR